MEQLTPLAFCGICLLVGLGGFVDSIAGGGGLITLPAYLIGGLPVHAAVATNKISSASGTLLTTIRFAREGMIRPGLAVPTVAAAMAGSALGAQLSLKLNEKIMLGILLATLPVVAFAVFNKHILKDIGQENERITPATYLTATLVALVIGAYDGIYGPGTGTFLIIALTVFSKLSMRTAAGHTKLINLASNLTSLTVFLLHGQAVIPLGIAAGLCNMAGAYIGSGMMLTKGMRIVRPVMLCVLLLLFVKAAADLL